MKGAADRHVTSVSRPQGVVLPDCQHRVSFIVL
jgi:hypothetical protein